MDQYGYLGLAWRLQHRHGDAWVTLQERMPDPPEDEALHWGGRVFVCPDCNEEVRLVESEPETRPATG